jgi:hypothetical protein
MAMRATGSTGGWRRCVRGCCCCRCAEVLLIGMQGFQQAVAAAAAMHHWRCCSGSSGTMARSTIAHDIKSAIFRRGRVGHVEPVVARAMVAHAVVVQPLVVHAVVVGAAFEDAGLRERIHVAAKL